MYLIKVLELTSNIQEIIGTKGYHLVAKGKQRIKVLTGCILSGGSRGESTSLIFQLPTFLDSSPQLHNSDLCFYLHISFSDSPDTLLLYKDFCDRIGPNQIILDASTSRSTLSHLQSPFFLVRKSEVSGIQT